MAYKIWNGSVGSWTDASKWFRGVPGKSDYGAINSGQVTINGVDTTGVTVSLDAVQANTTTSLTVANATLTTNGTTYLTGYGNVAYLYLENANTAGTLVSSYGPAEVIIPAGYMGTNHGWWAISSSTGSSLTTVANGTFVNAGAIETGSHGSYALVTTQNQVNLGTFQSDPGGALQILSGNGAGAPPNLTNQGLLFDNGGNMFISTDVNQAGGSTRVTGGGTLTLAGKFSGDSIEINNATLNFSPSPTMIGPYAALNLTASVDFSGQSGEIDIGKAVTAAYRPDTNDILVTTPYQGTDATVADIHLYGSYTADEFTFGNNGQIYFHHS